MRFAPIMVGVAAIAAACGKPALTNQERELERGRVQARFDEWVQRVNNRELDSLFTMYNDSPDLVVAWSDGFRTLGLADHEARTHSFFDQIQFLNLVPQSPVHEVLDQVVATTTFRYSIDMVLNDTSRDPYSGQAQLVWVKGPDDMWRIHNEIFSRTPAR